MTDQDTPEERETKFYALYGRCINQWAFIEQHYFDFFCFALGTTRRKAALIFYGYGQFGQKIERTGAMMKVVLQRKAFELHRKSWDDILKTTKKLSEFRNELAHEPIRDRVRLRVRLKLAPGQRITNVSPPPTKDQTGLAGAGGKFQELFRPDDKVLGGKNRNLFKDSLPGILHGHLSTHLEEMQALNGAIEKLKAEMGQTAQQRYLRLAARVGRGPPQKKDPSGSAQ